MDSFQDPAGIAARYINNTNRNIFLTGKAGTGKTTFLKDIKERTYKNAVVAAPTGIAAINAGGVTLHSLFQLPFGSFIPEESPFSSDSYDQYFTTPKTLLSRMQLHSTKRKLLNEMELLIIDEVSMLRADLLDAIDHLLRHVRRQRELAFGGVQVLFIGDLLQLPPVVKDQEWDRLKQYYKSPFFFEAQVIQNSQLVYVELEKVYRQSDDEFLSLLNRLRQNMVSEDDLNLLNQYAQYDYQPEPDEGYIYITTHNKKADRKNEYELGRLENEPVIFEAEVSGDFEEHSFPHADKLVLKEGAQVMFIKNDPSGEQKFFNGKIGTVTYVDPQEILVKCTDGEMVDVQRYTWENKKYTIDKSNDEIEEKTVGTFAQYPLRLAWAITVHKSQGLTFERAILDLSHSFTAGQVYVALSRLTSLKGLMLASPIPETQFEANHQLVRFATNKKEVDELNNEFGRAAKDYHQDYIEKVFDFGKLQSSIFFLTKNNREAGARSPRMKYQSFAADLSKEITEWQNIGRKFARQAKAIIFTDDDKYLDSLEERVTKAQQYFEPKIIAIEKAIREHRKEANANSKLKSYTKDLQRVQDELFFYKKYLHKLRSVIRAARTNNEISKSDLVDDSLVKSTFEEKKKVSGSKKPTRLISFELHKDGLTIEEIAEKRGLVDGTIAGHLAHYVKEGELSVADFVDLQKIDDIAVVIEKIASTNLAEIKQKLGEEYTYADIKFALAHLESLKSQVEK